MQYLCAKHCRVVQQSREQALRLWRGAYSNGLTAYRREQWPRAKSFLGTAYEIAVVRFALDVDDRQQCLSAGDFAAVGRYYTNVLCRLQEFEEAEVCLRRMHDGLLHWSTASDMPYQERLVAYEQLEEYRQRLVALLEMRGKAIQARCVDLLARQMAREAASGLCH